MILAIQRNRQTSGEYVALLHGVTKPAELWQVHSTRSEEDLSYILPLIEDVQWYISGIYQSLVLKKYFLQCHFSLLFFRLMIHVRDVLPRALEHLWCHNNLPKSYQIFDTNVSLLWSYDRFKFVFRIPEPPEIYVRKYKNDLFEVR